MRQSSILLAKIANDAGLPISKAERILAELAATGAGGEYCRGFDDGLRGALVMLGAPAPIVDRYVEIKKKENYGN